MKSLQEYHQWFKANAQELPDPVRLEVLNGLDTSDYRSICFALASLRESGKLPQEWDPVLDDFCFSTY